MSWNQLTLDVPDDFKDAVMGELGVDSFAGVWESDSSQAGCTRLVVYLHDKSDIPILENRLEAIFDRNASKLPVISRSFIDDRDWTEEWKKSYVSFPVGDDFYVIPSWETCSCPDDRLPIRIDPGQAFGTGTHETTQLSIEALERWVDQNQRVLDVGTAPAYSQSPPACWERRGIRLRHRSVSAQVAHANVERNAENEIWTFCGSVDAVRSNSIQLVLGNLAADLIADLFPEIDRVLKPRGIAILSGILSEQQEEIRELILLHHYSIFEEIVRGEWLAIVVEKNVA